MNFTDTINLKELEDLRAFPHFLRRFQTDFIGYIVCRFRFYERFIDYINSLALSPAPMEDLCSGGGEPALSIFRKTNCFTSLELTDKFPNYFPNSEKNISHNPASVDVTKKQFESGKWYTMFNALHHFSDKEKLKLVEKIQQSGSGAFFVEILEPSFLCFLQVLITTTLGNLFLAPFIRPFSFLRLLFTYIIPINILTTSYDGIISVLKSKSVAQYKNLFANTDSDITVQKLKGKLNLLIVIQIHPGTNG